MSVKMMSLLLCRQGEGGRKKILDYGGVLFVQHLPLILWNMAAFARMTEHGRS